MSGKFDNRFEFMVLIDWQNVKFLWLMAPLSLFPLQIAIRWTWFTKNNHFSLGILKECPHCSDYFYKNMLDELWRAFWIAQVPFALECKINCGPPNGNSVHFGKRYIYIYIYNFHVYYQITIWSIFTNLLNGTLVVDIKIVNIFFPKSTELPFGWLHSNSNANGIWGILGAHFVIH